MTTNEEQQVEAVEGRTIGERMAAVESQQELLIEVVRENGRRSDENYRVLDAKIDALNSKIDRVMYFLLGVGGAVVVGIVIQLVS